MSAILILAALLAGGIVCAFLACYSTAMDQLEADDDWNAHCDDALDVVNDLHEWQPFSGADQDWLETSLKPLLRHSDCDGYLDSYECEEMLPRLREIADKWSAPALADPALRYDTVQLLRLIDGMEHSVDHGCSVVFS